MASIRKLLIENLRRLRKSRGFTQERLAEAAGMSLGGYQQIEYEKHWPSDSTLERIAVAMGVPVSALFSDKDLVVKPSPAEALKVLQELVDIGDELQERGRIAKENEEALNYVLSVVQADLDDQVRQEYLKDWSKKRLRKKPA